MSPGTVYPEILLATGDAVSTYTGSGSGTAYVSAVSVELGTVAHDTIPTSGTPSIPPTVPTRNGTADYAFAGAVTAPSVATPSLFAGNIVTDGGIIAPSGTIGSFTGRTAFPAGATITAPSFGAWFGWSPPDGGAATIDVSTHTLIAIYGGVSDLTNAVEGQVVILKCAQTCGTTRNGGVSGRLALSADWIPGYNDTLTLVYSSGYAQWYEVARSANH
jgi:hypothetical protein